MFSGIVETQSPILSARPRPGVVEIHIKRPSDFNDLSIGESICVDGVCLTIESFDQEKMVFALAAETLQVTGWSLAELPSKTVNLERSLAFGARVHGHLVTGHVEGLGRVMRFSQDGEIAFLKIGFPEQLAPYFWRKGSVAINGVSLTINRVEGNSLEVCLIPETLKRTNLGGLSSQGTVNLEVDPFARGVVETSRFFFEQHQQEQN
ncbi:MAG: riboflavin synthase [Bdellovibrionaceae bacterium]|nr:riboflavin synthase [Bdellovibrionales bacterium]MCB9084695.1 riboflavin synthase [Pseudobdellovibrionaceae bacterium]